IIFTSLFTTSSAIFSGMTKPNISTNNLTRSGLLPLGGRYIIGRESPTATNEKPRASSFAAVPFSAAAAGPATSTNTAMNANKIEQTFVGGLVCFIFYLLSLMGSSVHEVLDPQSAVGALAICLISSCDYPSLFPPPYVHYGWLIKNTLLKKQR